MTQLFEQNLFDYLQNEEISLRDRMKIAIEIGNGIAGLKDYANGHHLNHLDLKPTNIYLNTLNGSKHERICIADSGIARCEDDGLSDARTGTALFASPEQLVLRSNHKTDIYAYGKILVLVFFKWKMAWWLLGSERDERVEQVFKMNPLTDMFDEFVSQMLNVDYKNRPNIEEVMEYLKIMKDEYFIMADEYERLWEELHKTSINEVLEIIVCYESNAILRL